MKKLTLNLDELAVESFPTTRSDEELRGTVRAAEALLLGATRALYCTHGDTCKTSCAGGPYCLCPV